MHIDRGVKKDCWNLYDSHGEICVGCGCCSNDKEIRYKARIACLKERIKDAEAFDFWDDDPKFRKIQEKNVSENIQYWQGQLKYYEKCLWKIEHIEEE